MLSSPANLPQMQTLVEKGEHTSKNSCLEMALESMQPGSLHLPHLLLCYGFELLTTEKGALKRGLAAMIFEDIIAGFMMPPKKLRLVPGITDCSVISANCAAEKHQLPS